MRLAPAAALRAATYVLVADGLGALYVGGLLGPAGLALGALAVAGSVWREPLKRRVRGVRGLRAILVGCALAVLAADFLWLAASLLDALTHLLLALIVYRLYTGRRLRDARDVAFLAFFMLVIVAALTYSPVFIVLFAVFLVAGTWMLMLRTIIAESPEAGAPGAPPRIAGLGYGLAMVGAVAGLVTVALTLALFFVIPRVGQAALPFRASMGRMVSGFSERVELGAFGEIEVDETVVMRVALPAWPPGLGSPEQLPLRWRGIAFDRFDGRVWTADSTRRRQLRRTGVQPFVLDHYTGGRLLTQEIYLEPIGSDSVFAAPRPLRLDARTGMVEVDDLGNLAVPAADARLHYTVESELEPSGTRMRQPAPHLDAATRAGHLALPVISARVAALAREVTAGSADDHEAARRLTAYLARELRYTRVLLSDPARDPIEDFLFVRRAGNCEYFAAALAVMLRSLDIPARVVNGFQRGEWNPYGGYFMVRLRDAHSWVEAWLPGAGWVTLDASPRGDPEQASALRGAGQYLDALRLRWYRYIVSWSLGDQAAAAITVRRAASRWSAWSVEPPDWARVPRLVLAALLLAAAGAAAVLLRRATGPAAVRPPAPPAFYARALRALARRGLAPAPGETAREFAQRVERSTPACAAALGQLTGAYERVRFGARALTPAEAADVDRWLTAVERGR